MGLVELTCQFTRAWNRYIQVQSAHQKAHRHVMRMQDMKPTASRAALESALAKRERTGYALMMSSQKLNAIRRQLVLEAHRVSPILCSAGIRGECKSCRNFQLMLVRQDTTKLRAPRGLEEEKFECNRQALRRMKLTDNQSYTPAGNEGSESS